MKRGPSTHLTWEELACHDGTKYPDKFILDGRIFQLAVAFEDIRAVCGNEPIRILSAYRTPEWNKKVGGARFSQHVEGRALDLQHSKMKNYDFYQTIYPIVYELGIHGIGLYRTFVHVDIRPINKLVTWKSGLQKEQIA